MIDNTQKANKSIESSGINCALIRTKEAEILKDLLL